MFTGCVNRKELIKGWSFAFARVENVTVLIEIARVIFEFSVIISKSKSSNESQSEIQSKKSFLYLKIKRKERIRRSIDEYKNDMNLYDT